VEPRVGEPWDEVVVPPRPRRPRPGATRPRRASGALRWTAALAALLAAGGLVALAGWRALAPAADVRPGPRCLARAVEDARAFTRVLGDPRPVVPADVERSCLGRP
jgi:hypothetical protein